MLGPVLRPILKKVPSMLKEVNFEGLFIQYVKESDSYDVVLKNDGKITKKYIPSDELHEFFEEMLKEAKL